MPSKCPATFAPTAPAMPCNTVEVHRLVFNFGCFYDPKIGSCNVSFSCVSPALLMRGARSVKQRQHRQSQKKNITISTDITNTAYMSLICTPPRPALTPSHTQAKISPPPATPQTKIASIHDACGTADACGLAGSYRCDGGAGVYCRISAWRFRIDVCITMAGVISFTI